MAHAAAVALSDNSATRLMLGHNSQHAVPITTAQRLRRILEGNTSLTAFTLHTQYTPPEAMRILLMGAARCRSLEYLRLIGGINVLQSKMLMTAFAQFTFAPKCLRAQTSARRSSPAGRHCPPVRVVTQRHVKKEPEAQLATFVEPVRGAGHVEASGWQCSPRYQRLRSPAILNAKAARSRFSSPVCGNGVHVVLDVQHMDNVVAGFLVKGLEKSDRIIGLDVHVVSASQAVAFAACRLLSRTDMIVARNAQRLSRLYARRTQPMTGTTPPQISQEGELEARTSPHSPRTAAYATPPGGDSADRFLPLSSSDTRLMPTRRYTPPQLLGPHLRIPAPPSSGTGAPYRLFVTNSVFTTTDNSFLSSEACENAHTLEDHYESYKHNKVVGADGGKITVNNSPSAAHCPSQATFSAQSTDKRFTGEHRSNSQRLGITVSSPPTPQYKPHAPTEHPPSHQGQLVQNMRYLRSCVKELNSTVVRYQVATRQSLQKMLATMNSLEEEFTEGIAVHLAGMLVSISEVEQTQ